MKPTITRRTERGYVVTLGPSKRVTIAADPATAHALYAAERIALGLAAGTQPYPVSEWDALPDAHRERWLRAAAVFAVLGHLPLPERLYASCQTDWTVKPWGPGLKTATLWERIAAVYAAMTARQEAA